MNSNAGLSACQVRSLSRLFLESTVHPSGSRSVVFEVFAEDVSISVGSCRRQVAQPGSDSHGTFYKFFDGVAVGVAQNLEPCRRAELAVRGYSH